MKHFSKIILILVLLGFPVFAQEQPTLPVETVYITTSGSGKRYHLEDCRTLKNSTKKEIVKSEAKRQGYTPCGICKPED